MNKRTAGIVTNVFSILFWIDGIIVLLMALSLFFGGMVPSTWLVEFLGTYAPGVSSMTTWLLGVLLVALGILEVFIGRGLWRRESWARTSAVVLCILALFTGWLGIVVGLVGIWFLGFAKSIKTLFKHARDEAVPKPPRRAPKKKAAKHKPAKRKAKKKPAKRVAKRKPAKKKRK